MFIKFKEKRSVRRTGHRWKDNIKTYLKENGLECSNLASVACCGEYCNETDVCIKGGTFRRETLSFKNNYPLSTLK